MKNARLSLRRTAKMADSSLRPLIEVLEPRALLSASIWGDAVMPTVSSFDDPKSAELGVRFRSDTPGFVTGVRFYKGAANIGTHLGHLWSSSGDLLGSAIFAEESASGWQEMSFDSPIQIETNTTYIASYFAPAGHYAVNAGYFASSGVDNSPLHALRDGEDGGNGLFAYSSGATVPNFTFNSNNYWVDVAFDTTLVPEVTHASPSPEADSVDAKVTFNVPMDPTSINSDSVFLRDPENVLVRGTVTYSRAHRTATFTPSTPLAADGTYTLIVNGGSLGVRSTGGILLPSNHASSFHIQSSTSSTIWPASTIHAVTAFDDPKAAELGVRFRADTAGLITGIRFYKGSGNVGTHVGSLWTRDGALLARATFLDESTTGWQQVAFDTPVQVTAGTPLIASYHAPAGHYSVNTGYFTSSGVDNSPLHALRNGDDGGNGLFVYATTPTFPALSANSNNYWVDVVFAPAPLKWSNARPVATAQSVNSNE